MGIPVYFKTIIQDNRDIIDTPKYVDNLLFDLNCLIHPCCSGKTNESEMLEDIREKINTIIELVKPKFIYIAVDGPCPMPKIKQQRQRRFNSAKQNKQWDTNAITPGTKFMYKLDKFLSENFNKHNIELNLSSIPGEGEHKIFDYINKNNLKNNVVYGLDSDLIMLSIINKSNIHLVRERTEYNIECSDDEYIYLNIDKLKFNMDISPEDYIFICFFIGNDFIKNTPSINIRYHGLDVLIDTYKLLKIKYGEMFYLVNKFEENFINFEYFKEYIRELSIKENNRIRTILNIRDKQQKKLLSYTLTNDERILNSPIIDRDDEKEIFKNLNNWREEYYKYYNVSDTKKICENYIESFVWNIHYYINECINWQWYYKYSVAPSLKDIYEYLKTIDKFRIIHNDTKITPYRQLQLVFPESSFHLSKRKLKKNKSIEYPDELIESHVLKRYNWESIIINL